MSDTATFLMPVIASLLTAVLAALFGWVMLVPRIEERVKSLREYFDQSVATLTRSIEELKAQLANHAKEEREAAHDCENERKRIESELYAAAHTNAKDIAVLKQARNHGYVTE